jgi:hypothetical protein
LNGGQHDNYKEADDDDGQLVKTVKSVEIYRLSGSGEPPEIDFDDTVLVGVVVVHVGWLLYTNM